MVHKQNEYSHLQLLRQMPYSTIFENNKKSDNHN